MKKPYCPGCGALLQSEDPKASGFLPAEKQGEGVICQRCYKLLNYGKFSGARIPTPQLLEVVKASTARVDLTLLVVDFFDPEGSLAIDWDRLIATDIMLVINKADLIPPKTTRLEVTEWFKELWRRRFPHKPLADAQVISSRHDSLQRSAFRVSLEGKRVALVGATNVGKTSLLLNLLRQESKERKGKARPVVSNYPGTTQGVSSWRLEESRLEILDTPGLVPGSRMGDQLCPLCAARLLPVQQGQVKLWRLSPGEAVLLGDLAGIWNLSTAERLLLFFSSEQIKLHKTNGQKGEALLDSAPDWLRVTCAADLQDRMQEEEEITVGPGEDLFISGLGWVGVKKEPADLRLVLKKKAMVGIRPSLVGGNKKDEG